MMHGKKKRKWITSDELNAEYERCLQREEWRDKNRLRTKQGAFEASFVRYEQLPHREGEETPVDKLRCAAPLGAVIADTDVVPETLATNKQKLDYACQRLRRHGLGYLVATLRLIAKNVNNREETIWEMMQQDGRRQNGGTSVTVKKSAVTSASRSANGRTKTPPKKGVKSVQPKKS